MPRRTPLLLVLIGLALLAQTLLPRGARADLDEKTWKAAKREATRLMKTPGELIWKDKVITRLRDDDSERAAELLVKWARASLKLETKTLRPDVREAEEKFDKLVKLLLKAYDKMPPTQAEHAKSYRTLKEVRDAARAAISIEQSTQGKIAHAFSRVTNVEAITYLLDKGEGKVIKAKGPSTLHLGILKAYLNQPVERVKGRLMQVVKLKALPEARILILNWIGEKSLSEAFQSVVACLAGPEDAVRRSAVFTLELLNDPRCVPALIKAMAKADGLYLQELEAALHFFTGQAFDESHKVWTRWWKAEGEAWLSTAGDTRHEKRPSSSHKGGTTSFYGVETKSKRIIFVLDRSGSMKSPASEASRKPERPKGPVTGGNGKKDKEAKPDIKGDTKMEVAKNQLHWSIKTLPKKVHFNVVFYSTGVDVWKAPPHMHQATPGNKEAARGWFEKIEANGSTRMFDALLKALEYAATEGGADTIFLLSDGSPTIVGGGKALQGAELEAEYGAFTEKNKIYKCVVHTIGVGPGHNRALMQRIARDTGGTYQGIGNK